LHFPHLQRHPQTWSFSLLAKVGLLLFSSHSVWQIGPDVDNT
jgi:hypothetical protein